MNYKSKSWLLVKIWQRLCPFEQINILKIERRMFLDVTFIPRKALKTEKPHKFGLRWRQLKRSGEKNKPARTVKQIYRTTIQVIEYIYHERLTDSLQMHLKLFLSNWMTNFSSCWTISIYYFIFVTHSNLYNVCFIT